MTHDFDTSRFYLGKLCPHGHDYNRTGQSLRYKNSWKCVRCKALIGKSYKQQNKELCARRDKVYRENNKAKISLYKQKWAAANHSKIRARQNAWTKRNHERVKETKQRYIRSFRGQITRSHNRIRRRLRYRNISVTGNYTQQQWQQQLERFDYACAYCGRDSDLTVDHVIPISKGGCNLIWNVVPVCARCNSSKCDKDLSEWYKLQPFYDEDREFWVNYWTGQDYQEWLDRQTP